MELKLGKMTMKELSLWFGRHEKYISNSSKSAREKAFKKLSVYADYHWEGKSLIIDKIKHPVYTKAFDIIEEEFPKNWGDVGDSYLRQNKIDTCARVGAAIWSKYSEVKGQIKLVTAKSYVNKVKVNQYGHNYLDDAGTKGRSEYVWMNEDGTAMLSDEQMTILKECVKEAYNTFDEKVAAIDDDFRHGLINKEERDKAVGEIETISNYDRFIELVVDRLGFIPEKRTRLVDTQEW